MEDPQSRQQLRHSAVKRKKTAENGDSANHRDNENMSEHFLLISAPSPRESRDVAFHTENISTLNFKSFLFFMKNFVFFPYLVG